MARLMAPLCLVTWLIIALTALACGDNIFRCVLGRSSGKSMPLEEVKSIRANLLGGETLEQLENLAKACAKILLDKKLFKKIDSEEAVKIVDDVQHYLILHLSTRWQVIKNLGLANSWIDVLLLRERTRGCDGNSVNMIVESAKASKYDKWQFNYVLYCFRLYLDNCDYENRYKTVIGSIKENRWSSYELTLDSFLRRVFWTHDEDINLDNLEHILSFVTDLYRIETDYGEKICEGSDVQPKFKELINRSSQHPRQLRELMKDRFAIYLEKCGFEKRFKDAMNEHKVAIDRGDSPLTSYLWGDFFKSIKSTSHYGQEIINALEVVDHLHGKFNCDTKVSKKIGDFLFDARRKRFTKFSKCLLGTFTSYLEACADQFKEKIRDFANNDALLSIRDYAAEKEKQLSSELKQAAKSSREIIRRILHDSFSDAKRVERNRPEIDADFIKLRANCLILLESFEPFIDALMYDPTPATKDDEIMKFMNDIGYCSYNIVNSGQMQGDVGKLFEALGVPYIPTKAQPKRPKLK